VSKLARVAGLKTPTVERRFRRFLTVRRSWYCGTEYILAYSCKTRYFCPSCQAKRVAAFVEWVSTEILEVVDHRQYVWTIPKVLRPTFRRQRRLLGELVRCAWKSLREYTKAQLGTDATCGAIFAIQSWGDKIQWHPHLHSLVSDVAWDRDSNALAIGPPDSAGLTKLFQHHVLEMLVGQRCLSRDFAAKLRSWHHSGFQAWVGGSVSSDDSESLERVSAYIVRPSFAGSRLSDDETTSEVEYQTTKGKTQSMDALEWIALVTSHIPDVYEQTVRYCGRYSNASRGKRRKQAAAPPSIDAVGSVAEPDSPAGRFARERRRNWARLLGKRVTITRLSPGQTLNDS
jgi:hypothetical protein